MVGRFAFALVARAVMGKNGDGACELDEGEAAIVPLPAGLADADRLKQGVKVAVTARLALIVTLAGLVLPVASPDQLPKA